MNFTGYTYRYFSDIQQCTFVFSNIQASALEIYTGATPYSGQEVRIGLTGIHTQTGWYFAFKNGKIYDPEGRMVSAYNEADFNTISGNLTTGNYEYHINNALICTQGKKPNVDFNGWFVNCVSGASAQANISIYGPTINCSVNFPPTFTVGGTWTGTFTHTNVGPLVIRSGLLTLFDANFFYLSGTGLSFNNGTNVVPSGGTVNIQIAHTGITEITGIYYLGLRVYTDFGQVDFFLTGQSQYGNSGYVGNSLSPSSGFNIVVTGNGVTGSYTYYFSTSLTSYNGAPLSTPVYAELSYVTGITGQMYALTGVQITNIGDSYVSTPLLSVSPDIGFPSATGTVIMNNSTLDLQVVGVQLTTTGMYTGNTGAYSVSFVGGSPDILARGVPLFNPIPITKSFGAQFSLTTGYFAGSGKKCSGVYNLSSGSTTLPANNNIIFLTVNYTGTQDTATLTYAVRASGLPDSISGVSIYAATGLAYRI